MSDLWTADRPRAVAVMSCHVTAVHRRVTEEYAVLVRSLGPLKRAHIEAGRLQLGVLRPWADSLVWRVELHHRAWDSLFVEMVEQGAPPDVRRPRGVDFAVWGLGFVLDDHRDECEAQITVEYSRSIVPVSP